MNRLDLTAEVSRILGDLLLEGTIDTASGSGIADTDIIFPNAGQLRGKEVYIHTTITGSQRQARIIATYPGAGSLSVTPSFNPVPTVGDQYFIFDRFRYSDIEGALDSAIRRAREIHLIDGLGTLSLVATQWEYAVPSGLRFIHSLRVVPSGNTDFELDDTWPIERYAWAVKTNPNGSRIISFDPRFIDVADMDNDIVQVLGHRRPNDMTVPTVESEIPENFLINHAAAILCMRRLGEGAEWIERYKYFRGESLRNEGILNHYPRPNSVLCENI